MKKLLFYCCGFLLCTVAVFAAVYLAGGFDQDDVDVVLTPTNSYVQPIATPQNTETEKEDQAIRHLKLK